MHSHKMQWVWEEELGKKQKWKEERKKKKEKPSRHGLRLHFCFYDMAKSIKNNESSEMLWGAAAAAHSISC